MYPSVNTVRPFIPSYFSAKTRNPQERQKQTVFSPIQQQLLNGLKTPELSGFLTALGQNQQAVFAQGSKGVILLLPNCPDVLIRIPKGDWRDLHEGKLSISPHDIEWLPALSEGKHDYAQPVARIRGKEICFFKKETGKHSGIPIPDILEKYGIDELLGNQPKSVYNEDTKPYRFLYLQHLKQIAQLPQQAFDDLAERIGALRAHQLYLDPCSMNLLVDTTVQRFNTVDHEQEIGPYENLLGMLVILMDTLFLDFDQHAVDASGQAQTQHVGNHPECVHLRQSIFKKAILAAFKAKLSFPEEAIPLNTFGNNQRSFGFPIVLQSCGFQKMLDDVTTTANLKNIYQEAQQANESIKIFENKLNRWMEERLTESKS